MDGVSYGIESMASQQEEADILEPHHVTCAPRKGNH